MSAHHSIVILSTRGKKTDYGYKTEHRVALVPCEPTFGRDSDTPGGNVELDELVVQKYFGRSRVMTDSKIAGGYAQALADHINTEHGIVRVSEFSDLPFPKEQPSQVEQRPNLTAVS